MVIVLLLDIALYIYCGTSYSINLVFMAILFNIWPYINIYYYSPIYDYKPVTILGIDLWSYYSISDHMQVVILLRLSSWMLPSFMVLLFNIGL